MSEDTIQRLLYYKNQLLTAQDFEDQQNYHRQKLGQLTQRFPPGIVRGLAVIISSQGANDINDPEAFLITEGLAIDADGNTIVVSKPGIRVPVDQFQSGKPYLSLKYTENKTRRSQSPLDDTKFNRVNEIVDVTWEKAPNISVKDNARITVAKIRLKTNADRPSEKVGSTCVIEDEAQLGDPTIRQDAGLITEKQIAKNAISAEKIKDKAISQEKLADDIKAIPKGSAGGDLKGEYPNPTIADSAVKSANIANWVAGSNPVTGIMEAHLKDGAVTKVKLADDAIDSDKLENGSVKSAKIANWVAGSDPETGIKEAHIQDSAINTAKLKDDSVKSAKIANWVANSNPETGIKEAHIQDGAINTAKLKDDSVKSAKIANWVANSNPETGIKEAHIQDGAINTAKLKDDSVKSAKIAKWDASSNPETGIKNEHIQNGAVTSDKLQLVNPVMPIGVVSIPALGPSASSQSYTVEVSPSEIIQVIPTTPGGPLSWSSQVEFVSANKLRHTITVKNENTVPASPAVNFKIVKINFGN